MLRIDINVNLFGISTREIVATDGEEGLRIPRRGIPMTNSRSSRSIVSLEPAINVPFKVKDFDTLISSLKDTEFSRDRIIKVHFNIFDYFPVMHVLELINVGIVVNQPSSGVGFRVLKRVDNLESDTAILSDLSKHHSKIDTLIVKFLIGGKGRTKVTSAIGIGLHIGPSTIGSHIFSIAGRMEPNTHRVVSGERRSLPLI